MREQVNKHVRQSRRKSRVRKKVFGTPGQPRLSVVRSHRNIAVQLIDDLNGRTLCATSSRSKEFRTEHPYGGNVKAAAAVGKILAEKAKIIGVERVCFDRAGRKYHGRIKALADAAREAGLKL
jgi:large subunit ribosomal protein L18